MRQKPEARKSPSEKSVKDIKRTARKHCNRSIAAPAGFRFIDRRNVFNGSVNDAS